MKSSGMEVRSFLYNQDISALRDMLSSLKLQIVLKAHLRVQSH